MPGYPDYPDGTRWVITLYDPAPQRATLLGWARYERACAEAFYRVLASTPSLPYLRGGEKIFQVVRYSIEVDDAAYLRLKTIATGVLNG